MIDLFDLYTKNMCNIWRYVLSCFGIRFFFVLLELILELSWNSLWSYVFV